MTIDPNHVIETYGYWGIAGIVALESMGIPLPGETILIAAAAWAGLTHHLRIELVITAAAAGAIVGDFIGFQIGRQIGCPLLLRYGTRIGLTEPRLKLAQYFFRRHGGKVVFFGRFIAVLRALAALLAGTNQMSWRRFLLFNALGGISWATAFGVLAYLFGTSISRIADEIGIAFPILAVTAAVIGLVLVKRYEQRLILEAEKALPGPLCGPHLHRKRRNGAGPSKS